MLKDVLSTEPHSLRVGPTQPLDRCLSRGCRGVFTGRHTVEDRHAHCLGLTGSERVVHRAGDPSLPGEQGPAQAHVVRRVSDAELGHQQQPARPLHLRGPVLLRPSAGWGGSSSAGTVTSARACSLPKTSGCSSAETKVRPTRVADLCSGGFFLTDSGFLPDVGGARWCVQALSDSNHRVIIVSWDFFCTFSKL